MAVDPIEIKPTNNVALYKTIKVSVATRKQVVFRLTDAEGKPVDLREEPSNAPAPAPSYVNSLPVQNNNVSVQLIARDAMNGNILLRETGVIVPDDCGGLVAFTIQIADTCRPGIFSAAIGRFAGQYLVDEWPCFIDIQSSLFQKRPVGVRDPLTISEVRLAMRDLQLAEVSLLDALEYSDAEIMQAMTRVVDLWNDTSPHIRGASFMPGNFPYREPYLTGTMAFLCATAAQSYDRNQLAYSAGGVSIDDQNKGPAYQARADRLKQEFTAWMMRKKRELNMARAWRTGI